MVITFPPPSPYVETNFVLPPLDIGEVFMGVDAPPLLLEELNPPLPELVLLDPPFPPLEELLAPPLFPPLPPPLLRTKLPPRVLKNGRNMKRLKNAVVATLSLLIPGAVAILGGNGYPNFGSRRIHN
jgi:hypothetical protein